MGYWVRSVPKRGSFDALAPDRGVHWLQGRLSWTRWSRNELWRALVGQIRLLQAGERDAAARGSSRFWRAELETAVVLINVSNPTEPVSPKPASQRVILLSALCPGQVSVVACLRSSRSRGLVRVGLALPR
jgi:hypothetical protein